MSEHQEIWCQPSDQSKRQFVVIFDDPQMDLAAFDDETEARAFWEKANINRNCYLLGTLPRSSAPSGSASLSLGITKEWFERRAKAEADLEIGAGFSVVNMTDADIAQMEVLAERALPEWAKIELDRLRAIALDLQKQYIIRMEALQKIANVTSRCEHDGGFDRDIGPIGCNLGDKCVCIGIHPIVTAALQTGSFSFRDEAEVLPQDIINLVITAREAFDTGMLPDDESHALDKALEAFSSRVPYENEPEAALQQQEEGM